MQISSIAVQGVAATRKVWIGSAAEAARAEVPNVGRASDALSSRHGVGRRRGR